MFMYTILIPLLLVTVSCSSSKLREKQVKAWETWKGRPVSEVDEHPYFKNIKVKKKVKHEDGLETWVFKDQTPVQTSAYCQSLGGCISMPIYNCESAFSIQNGMVLGLEQTGTCPDLKTTSALKK